MIRSFNIKQNDDIQGMLDPEIMAYGSIAQVHSDVSAAICNVKARDREKQIRAMPDAQKKDFLDIRAKNVRNCAETNEELKSIREQLQKQAREGVRVDKFAVQMEKYRLYTEAGFMTKHFLTKIERYAFSLLKEDPTIKQDPTKIVIQLNGCITINKHVLEQKVKDIELDKLRKKQDEC
jgi:hypothetical protein